MTKTLTDTLGMPSLEEALKVAKELEEESKETLDKVEATMDSKELVNMAKNTPMEIPTTDEHDAEMDDIAEKALDSYDALFQLGMEVTPAHSGKIFESAVQMLSTALSARNSKSDKKLKLMKLQLDKRRLEMYEAQNPTEGEVLDGDAIFADRNDILKRAREEAKNNK